MRSVTEERPAVHPRPEAWPTRGRVVIRDFDESVEIPGTIDLSRQEISLELAAGSVGGIGPSAEVGASALQLAGSFAEADLDLAAFMPAAAFAFKAKSFNDGVLAVVEVALDSGTARFPGKSRFLSDLLRDLIDAPADPRSARAAVVIEAARMIAGSEGDALALPPDLAREAGRAARRFLSNPPWGPPGEPPSGDVDLLTLRRREAFLRQSLDDDAWRGLADAIAASEDMLSRYTRILEAAEWLRGPFQDEDLRWRIRGVPRSAWRPPGGRVALFPASEPDIEALARLLAGSRGPGAGPAAGDGLLVAVREGELFRELDAGLPWAIQQAGAYAVLAAPDRAPERVRLRFGSDYLAELGGLFRTLMGESAEPHSPAPRAPAAEQPTHRGMVAEMAPNLSVEPVPEYYRRQALVYRRLRGALSEILGEPALATMARLASDRALEMPLLHELILMERLFHGAYLTSCTELGLSPDLDGEVGTMRGPVADMQFFKLWQSCALEDPDLATDVRVVFPVAAVGESGRLTVRAIMGIGVRRLEARFDGVPPLAGVSGGIDPATVTVFAREAVLPAAALVTAETEVGRLPGPGEFRALCDAHSTIQGIIDALGRIQ